MYSSKSCLSDTKPERNLANILEIITPTGHGITGGDVITINGQDYSFDRTLTWFTGTSMQAKKRIRFEAHADHDWFDRPKADIKKCELIAQYENLIDIFLDGVQMKNWCEQIIFAIKDAMDDVNKGKRIYRSIYQHKGVLHIGNRVGIF